MSCPKPRPPSSAGGGLFPRLLHRASLLTCSSCAPSGAFCGARGPFSPFSFLTRLFKIAFQKQQHKLFFNANETYFSRQKKKRWSCTWRTKDSTANPRFPSPLLVDAVPQFFNVSVLHFLKQWVRKFGPIAMLCANVSFHPKLSVTVASKLQIIIRSYVPISSQRGELTQPCVWLSGDGWVVFELKESQDAKWLWLEALPKGIDIQKTF